MRWMPSSRVSSAKDGVFDVSTIEAPASFTIAGIVALVFLVLSAIGAIGSLRAALRTLSDEVHDDAFWIWVMVRNFLLALAIGAGFLLSAIAALFGSAFLEVIEKWTGIDSTAYAGLLTGFGAIVVVFVLDTGLFALVFVSLSGLHVRARTLWVGALLAGVGLTVLQQLSGLFVQGADNNPLLASFAVLIALLLWVNLSAQVILIASTWIIIGAARRRGSRPRALRSADLRDAPRAQGRGPGAGGDGANCSGRARSSARRARGERVADASTGSATGTDASTGSATGPDGRRVTERVPTYTAAQVRAAELPLLAAGEPLMDRAAAALAAVIREEIPDASTSSATGTLSDRVAHPRARGFRRQRRRRAAGRGSTRRHRRGRGAVRGLAGARARRSGLGRGRFVERGSTRRSTSSPSAPASGTALCTGTSSTATR